MAVDDRVAQKTRKIESMIHLFPKQKGVDVGKLISSGSLLDR